MRHVITYAKDKIKRIFQIIHDLKSIIQKDSINIDEFVINLKIIPEIALRVSNEDKKKIIFIRKKNK